MMSWGSCLIDLFFMKFWLYRMAIRAVKRSTNRSEMTVYSRFGTGGGIQKAAVVCKFWVAGNCIKESCAFLHTKVPTPVTTSPRTAKKNSLVWTKENMTTRDSQGSITHRNIKSLPTPKSIVALKNVANQQSMAAQESPIIEKRPDKEQSPAKEQSLADLQNCSTHISNATKQIIPTQKSIASQNNNAITKPLEKVCKFWATGRCLKGDKCLSLHTWLRGDGISMLAKLQDHRKMITGIVLPEGFSKLYSASKDGTVRIWDCHTGHLGSVINLGGEAGSLFSKGPWVFAGAPNVVKAWNIQTNAEFCLSAPGGQVHALEVGNEMLFAGTEEGIILVWKDAPDDNPFQLSAPLVGHTGAVVCLKVEANKLYSGSADHTIWAWDLDTLQPIMILNEHSDVVTSLVFWGQFLISCSLDCTIKIWAGKGSLEATYTRSEDQGLLGLSGMADAEDKPVLLCSCSDNSLRLYELPSFADRGRIFAKEQVGAIQVGPDGLFFSGDATGLLSVWKWMEPGPKVESS